MRLRSRPANSAPANQVGLLRRFGAIHSELADLLGRARGRRVADQAWIKAPAYMEGKHEDDEVSGREIDPPNLRTFDGADQLPSSPLLGN